MPLEKEEVRDIEAIIKKIDLELRAIDSELQRVNETVKADLDSMLAPYIDQFSPKMGVSLEEIKKRHLDDLSKKRRGILERARERLQDLKDEISLSKSLYAV